MSFEDRVRHELEHAGAMLPIVGVDLDRTVSRGRNIRRRNIVANVVIAAALVAGAVGGGVLLTSAPEPPPGPGPAGTPSDRPTPERSPSPSEDEGDQTRPSFDRVEPVLREWLSAIQESDEDRAWDLMTPDAQAALGRPKFDRMMASALPEGLGAFADAESFHYVVVTSEADQAQVLGIASGEVTREGSTEFAAIAIPMRVSGADTLVDDIIIDRTRYWDRQAVFASVSAGPQSFHSGDELIVEFADPRGATAAWIAVDGDRRPLPTEFDAESGLAVATLDRDLQEGRHLATVIVLHQTGRLYAEPILFQAAAP